MKFSPLAIGILLVLAITVESRFSDRKIFVSKFSGKAKSLADIQQIRKQIRDESLKNLKALPELVKDDLVKHADASLKGNYPVKTATDYLDYFKTGNRGHYEGKLHAHRTRISHLLVGNLLDQEKNATSLKYISEIVNGIWILAEESTWCYPAHLYLEKSGEHLPVPGHLAIDLNAGEVAKFLGWVKLLIGDRLDLVSPVVNKRIDAELRKRIFQGFLDMDGFFWEGFTGSHVVNNWNIWINGNILKSALFTLDDVALFDKVLNKTLYSADYFLDDYGEDGGCDEGPAYWRQAGGRLIEYLESLEQIFPGTAKDYFDDSKLIKSIGEYSYKMLITSNWFVNFADAIPTLTYPPSLLAKYGQLFNDDQMKQYSAYMLHFVSNSTYFATLTADINELFNFLNTHAEIEKYKPVAPVLDLMWLPDIQVVTTRSSKAAEEKFFLAAKAGNNHESHNHNDVGSFVLFQNGHPVFIDIGVGTYSAKTFGPHRYDLFYMQSQYHNTPTINGVQQKEGVAFNSKNTTLMEFPNQTGILFKSDISGTYPAEAKIKQWTRSIQFNRTTNSAQVDDQFQLEQFVAPQQLHFITIHNMTVTKNEHGLLLKQATNVAVQMDFDWKVFGIQIEDRSLENDHHLTQVWGESVKRITLTTAEQYKEVNGHFTVKFSHA